jgi:putative DNA primase/helicase
MRGSGKTLLASVGWCILYGRKIEVLAFPEDNGELKKTITGMLIGGQPMVTFDNVTSKVFQPSLVSALTAEYWSDRILGHSQIVRIAQRTIWTMTGNDLRVSDESARRCVMIRLDTPEEHPESVPHRIKHLEETLLEHRPRILQELLRVVKVYYDIPEKDRPKGLTKGSFQKWSTIIDGMLQHAGRDDLLGNIQELNARDSDTEDLVRFFNNWYDHFQFRPMTAREVVVALYGQVTNSFIRSMTKELGDQDFRDSLPLSFKTSLGKASELDDKTTALGNCLKRIQNKNHGGYRLKYDPDSSKRSSGHWRLEKAVSKK